MRFDLACINLALLVILAIILVLNHWLDEGFLIYKDAKGFFTATLELGRHATSVFSSTLGHATTSASISVLRMGCSVVGVGCGSVPEPADDLFPESAKVLNFSVNPEALAVHLNKEAHKVHSFMDHVVEIGGRNTIDQFMNFRNQYTSTSNKIRRRTDLPNRNELGQPVTTISDQFGALISALIPLKIHGHMTVDYFIFQFVYLDKTLTKLLDNGTTEEWIKFDHSLAQFHQQLMGHIGTYITLVTNAFMIASEVHDATEDASESISEAIEHVRTEQDSRGFFYGQVHRHFTVRGHRDQENREILTDAYLYLESTLFAMRTSLKILTEIRQSVESAQDTFMSQPASETDHQTSLEMLKITVVGFQAQRDRYINALK